MSEQKNQHKVKKTRNRVPTSCEYCRKRKLKCDRQKPCSNCEKAKHPQLCIYASSPKDAPKRTPRVNLNNEIIKLKLHINKLERILQINNIDISSYYHMMPQLDRNDLVKDNDEDQIISLTEKFDTMMIKENKILHSGTTSYITFMSRDKQLNQLMEYQRKKHLAVYEQYQNLLKTKASEHGADFAGNHLRTILNNQLSANEVCQLEDSNIPIKNKVLTNSETKLLLGIIETINDKLPPLYVVNILVDQFFKYVYPLIPLINEEIFREELSYVLISTLNGGCKLGITHFQNASIISLLLVILRYAYLSVNVKDYGEDNKSIGSDFLIAMIKSGIRIDSDFILLARSLLMAIPGEDSIFKKITLRNVQVLTFLRLYHVYAPEMHEENREQSLTLALIIQMCRSFGINRDPSNFPQVFCDPRENTVWRRIFYKLLSLDVNNAFEYGCPLIISDYEYDIKLPTLSHDNSRLLMDFKKGIKVSQSGEEIKRLVVEDAINKDIALEYQAIKLVREALNQFQNFSGSTTKTKLIESVRKIQDFIDHRIPSFWEYLYDSTSANDLESLYGVPKIRKFEIRLMLQTYVSGFYYLIYLNDQDEKVENKDNSEHANGGSNDFHSTQETLKRKSLKYSSCNVRAIETCLTILKINHDYTKYMTQSVTLDGDSKQYKALKAFSAKCDYFVLSRIQCSFFRAFFFLCSIFLRDFAENNNSVATMMTNFSNTIDATVALKWFNMEYEFKDKKPENEFCFLLFQRVKSLFFFNHSLRSECYSSWRISMVIKMFINFFKEKSIEECSVYLNPQLVSPEEEVTPELVSNGSTADSNYLSRTDNYTSSSTDRSYESRPGKTYAVNNFSIDDYMDNFMDTVVPDNIQMDINNKDVDLDDLISDNFNDVLNEMMDDSEKMKCAAVSQGLFNYDVGNNFNYVKFNISDEKRRFERAMNDIVPSGTIETSPVNDTSISKPTDQMGTSSFSTEGFTIPSITPVNSVPTPAFNMYSDEMNFPSNLEDLNLFNSNGSKQRDDSKDPTLFN